MTTNTQGSGKHNVCINNTPFDRNHETPYIETQSEDMTGNFYNDIISKFLSGPHS